MSRFFTADPQGATNADPADSPKRIAVSNLAGQSPHVRVQYENEGHWRHYATFRHSSSARDCADDLSGKGHQVRVVAFRIPPVAA